MAWFISEVITDVSIFPTVLSALENKELSFVEDDIANFLSNEVIQLDHIDEEDIPAHYKSIYHWLAADLKNVLLYLGLIQNINGSDSRDDIQLTNVAYSLLNGDISITKAMKQGLENWKNDNGIMPYTEIKTVLNELKQTPLYPCQGLYLVEIYLLLRFIHTQPLENINTETLYRMINDFRQNVSGKATENQIIDTLIYPDLIWDEAHARDANYHDVNYAMRSTLNLMMQAHEIVYEALPNDLFGLVQTVTIK